jgi:DNA polymerase III subunit gamma/tau
VDPAALQAFATFDQRRGLIREKRDMKLLFEVERACASCAMPPAGSSSAHPDAPPDLAARLAAAAAGLDRARWGVSVVNTGGAPTWPRARRSAADGRRVRGDGEPLVQAVLAAFPGARIAKSAPPRPKPPAPPSRGAARGRG